MSLLTISLKVPFEIDPSKDFGSEMVFTLWLPDGFDNGIAVTDGDMRITLWFDGSCVPSDKNIDELKRYVNLGVRYVKVSVQLDGLSDTLLAHMQTPRARETASEEGSGLEKEYKQLAGRVLTSVIKRVNRLVAAIRTIKGQHWLHEHTLDINRLRDTCLRYECRGRVDDGNSFRFCPTTTDTIIVCSEGEERYISEVDWPGIRNFVIGEGKTELVRELLAGAERLADVEHYRAALTEAVTALEVAVSTFSRTPKANESFGSHMAARMSVPSLAAQVKHLGISGTVNYLLPTILSEEILPTPVLTACQKAIRQRQTVVHQGQRDVQEGDAKSSIAAIRKLCEALECLSQNENQ